MSTLTWIHLSDFHFRVGTGHAWNRDVVLTSMLEDVRQFSESNDLRPDLILVSGDIAFSGQKDEYAEAVLFFDNLLKAACLTRDCLFVVPGNHDVDRRAISRGAAATASALTDRQAVNDVLTVERDRRLLFDRLNAYSRFWSAYFGGRRPAEKQPFYTKTLDLAGRRVAVVGLNTAWLAEGDSDQGRLALGERQARLALAATSDADLRIALMHHPFDWLRDFDREDCEPLLMDGCRFILHGHLHRTGLLSLQTPDAGAMIIAAGACYETRAYANAYNWVRLDFDAGLGMVHLREYSDRAGGFWTADTRTYRNAPDGQFAFSWPSAALSASKTPGLPFAVDSPAPPRHREDWGRAPDVAVFYGRKRELELLRGWIADEQCRLVAVVGMGGMGKTSLAVKLARQIAEQFERSFFRDLKNAPPLEKVLDDCILFLSDQQKTDPPENVDDKISLLIDYLRNTRTLIVLDNYDAIFKGGSEAGSYLDGCESYGTLIRLVGETQHQSCLVITSRESPKEMGLLEGCGAKSLHLLGLEQEDGCRLLQDGGLKGPDKTCNTLIDRYAGNPLALKQVAAQIRDVFVGNIAAFLDADNTGLVGIEELLDMQFRRLSDLEAEILYWLAVEREPVSLDDLSADIVYLENKRRLVDALYALQRRSMIEISAGLFTLQPVVMEYMISQLTDRVYKEITGGTVALLASHALIKARAKEYIRESQTRLILKPVADRLVREHGPRGARSELTKLLRLLRAEYSNGTGYAGGNIANLFVQIQGELRDHDFSGLTINQAYLIGVESHDVSFAGCNLAGAAFTEPFGSIVAVAFSPDGELFAAGTANNEVRLWRAADSRQLLILRGHTDWIRSLAFSPDGKWLASGSSDGTVRMWDARTGHCVRVLEGHADIVRSVAFRPDGLRLASSSDDQTVRLWDLATGRPFKTLHEPSTSWVWSIAFSPDGETLISGSEDKTVRLWEIETGECKRILRGHRERVRSIALDSGGKTLASGSDDCTVRLWDLDAGECVRVLEMHTDRVESVAFSPDDLTLASASDDQTIRLWDVAAGQCRSTLRGHTARVRTVAFNRGGDRLISGGDDHVGLWDACSTQCIRVLQGFVGLTGCVAYRPDGRVLASGHYDSTVRLWDVDTGEQRAVFRGHTKPVWAVSWCSDGGLLGSAGDDQTIRLWDPNTGLCLKTLRGHTAPILSLAFSPASGLLASASLDHSVRLWDVAGNQLMVLEGHTNRAKCVAFSPDGEILASGGEDHTLRLWNVKSGACLDTLSGHTNRVTSVAFSSNGRILASGGEDNTIRLWDLSGQRPPQILEGHASRVWSIVFSRDNNILVSGGEDRSIRLWDVETARCTRVIEGAHSARIWSLDIDPGGDFLASSSRTIKLWHLRQVRDARLTPTPRILECEKPYAGTDITGIYGLTEAEISSLRELGAADSRSHT